MTVGGKLYSPPNYPRAWRALIAAKYSKAKVEVLPYVPGETNTSADFLSKFPSTEVPVFEAQNGEHLFEINAIAYYLGNEHLRGGKHEAQVTQWANYAENVIMPAVAQWVYPCLGVAQPDKKLLGLAKTCVETAMKHLNDFLSTRTYLVGESITQADITLFTTLYLLMTHVYAEADRKPFPHVVRWYLTIANQQEVVHVAGKPDLCQKAAIFDAKKFAELHKSDHAKAKGDGEKKAGKKQEKQEKPKAEKPKDEAEEKPAPKAENPLAALPVGTFVMDEFKRTYSNNDTDTVALPYLWKNFDAEHYSIWHCEYKYPEELNLLFMSSNLVGGVLQRLEKMLKVAFGSLCVLGKDKDNTIQGIFIWRGTGLIMDIDPDLQIDYESFKWTKLDHTSAAHQKLIRDYLVPVDEIDGKPVASYKLFK